MGNDRTQQFVRHFRCAKMVLSLGARHIVLSGESSV